MVTSGEDVTELDLSEALVITLIERDELRADVKRLKAIIASLPVEFEPDEDADESWAPRASQGRR